MVYCPVWTHPKTTALNCFLSIIKTVVQIETKLIIVNKKQISGKFRATCALQIYVFE